MHLCITLVTPQCHKPAKSKAVVKHAFLAVQTARRKASCKRLPEAGPGPILLKGSSMSP